MTQPKKKPRLPNLKHFVALCHGNLRASTLLYQVCSWHRYATAERDGHKWIVNSRWWWEHETAMSPDQVKRAFAWLRAEELIVTEQHLWVEQGEAKNLNWVRPSGKTIKELALDAGG